MTVATCACEEWVTDGLHLAFETDAADGRVLALHAPGGFPSRLAITQKFAARLNQKLPGAAEWKNGRLIIRADNRETAYAQRGTCDGCGLLLIERD